LKLPLSKQRAGTPKHGNQICDLSSSFTRVKSHSGMFEFKD